MASYKLKLNSVEKTEALLQEIYDDCVRQQNLCQGLISELKESTALSDEPIENKTKFAKAINDFAATKDKAIGRKMDVAKIMAEILKYGGNVEKVMGEDEIYSKMNLGDELKRIREGVIESQSSETATKVSRYQTNPNKL